MRRKMLLAALAGGIVLALALASQAGAASWSNRVVAIEATAGKVKPAPQLAAKTDAVACYGRAVAAKGKTTVGLIAWKYKQRVYWCSDLVTKDNCNCWLVVNYPSSPTKPCTGTSYKITTAGSIGGWEFVRHVDCKYGGGVGHPNIYRWREGHFRYCPIKAGACVQDVFPFAWIKGNGNGLGTFTWGVGKK